MRILASGDFHWDSDNDLIFQKRAVCSLVKHETIPDHWHLKFDWRDEKTPEFFNIFNARENARLYSRWRYQETAVGASLVSLNEEKV
jgi:hypothetical protein